MMKTLAVALEAVEPGRVTLSIPHQVELTQQHGFLHAGALATVLDSACGYAAFSLMPADAAVLTVNNTLNLLAPAQARTYLSIATVTKAGRTVSVADGRVVDPEAPERPIATMTATLMAVYGRGIRQ